MPIIPFSQEPNDGIEVKDRLAVNMFDINLVPNELRRGLHIPENLNSTPIWIDRNKSDEYYLEFECDILKAAIWMDIIRSDDRRNNREVTRVCICKKVWQKLSSKDILTTVDVVGKSHLNRNIFNVKLPLSTWVPNLRGDS
jgi:hypothetical protein